MDVKLFSDGSSLGNPGPGGFGTILQYTDDTGLLHEKEISEGYELTTNNRMELLGVIRGLEVLKFKCNVIVTTDSKYVSDAFLKNWIDAWEQSNYRQNTKNPVKNIDLWKTLVELTKKHQVSWNWVKGHNGHPENERCDKLAVSAANSSDLKIDKNYI